MSSPFIRVRTRLLFGFGAALIAAVSIALVSYFSLRNLVSSRAELAQTKADDLADVEEIRSLFEQVSAETRGYFLTKNRAFLRRAQGLHIQLTKLFGSIGESLISPEAKALLKDTERLVLLHQSASRIEAKSPTVRAADFFESELHPIGAGVRKNLELLVRRKQDQLLAARQQAERAISTATGLIIAVAALAIVLAAILAFITSHTVSRLYDEIDALAKKREEAFALLRIWLESSPAGLSFLNPSLQCVHLNRKFASMLKISEPEVLGRSLSDVLPLHARPILDSVRSALKDQRSITDVTTLGENLLASYYPVFASNRTLVGVGIVLVDVSQLREMERELQRLSEDLRRSNQELEHFAYVASHDLREPLRTIRTFIQLLDQRLSGRLDRETIDYFRFIGDASIRLQNLIDALLEYARSGSHPLKTQTLDSKQLVDEVLSCLQSAVEESGARIEVSPSLPEIEGDAVLINQLFQNLISNAIKYCKEGPPRVEISFVNRGTEIEFCVRDHGIGFPSDQAERIFEVFRRLHGREEYGGVGIGLALCRRIVERHNGKIWAESTPGEGSVFHFTLPGPHRMPPTGSKQDRCETRAAS